MTIIGVDPGPKLCAWVEYDSDAGAPVRCAESPVRDFGTFVFCGAASPCVLAVEDVLCYSRFIGRDVFETAKNVGAIREAFWTTFGHHARYCEFARASILHEICGTTKASKANVRQALIDAFGGKDRAIGGTRCLCCKGKGKKYNRTGRSWDTCPWCTGSKLERPRGPLWAIKAHGGPHVWDAMAVAMMVARAQPS